MPVTYTIAIDRDDDGDFLDSGEDITADVLTMHWRLGMAGAHDSVAQPGTAQITVRNHSRTYSPENNALLPGQVLRIQSDDGSTVRTHFSGHISHVEPLPGDQGQQTAVIHAVDASAQLGQYSVRLPPQVNVRADEVIDAILDSVPLRRTKLKGYWLLGRVDHSELGTNTRLPIATIPRSLGAGQTTFDYAGDTWADGIAAIDAIGQMVEAERGRFFIDRSGQAVFYDRHVLLGDTTVAATFADDMSDMAYDYGADVVSRVQVRLIPRRVGVAGTTLWQLDSAQRLPDSAADMQQIVAHFRDDNDRPIGALTLIPPRRELDYTANTAADGSGVDVTDEVDVTLRTTDFSAAVLEVRNLAGRAAFLQAGAKLRGTPLDMGDPLLVEQTSHASLNLYSPQALLFDLPALDSIEQADSLARFELARRKTPRGRIHSLTVTNQSHEAQILARTLFDRITVQETQTAHNTDYTIVAEAHAVDLGGERHRATWTLENIAANTFWVLGRDLLNQTTILAY